MLNPSHNFIASKVQDSNEDERWPSLVFSIIEKEQFRKLLPTFKLEDYVKINQDYSSMEDSTILYQYYTQTKSHLSKDEIDFLIDDNFS